jgi:phosphohistidine swiveling domain-containing protein
MTKEVERAFLKLKLPHEIDNVLTPGKSGRNEKELVNILHLSEKYKDRGARAIDKDLKEHIFNYSWLKNTGYYGDFFPKAYYLRRIQSNAQGDPTGRLREIINEREQKRQNFRKLLNKINSNNKLKIISQTLNEAVYFRSFRSEEYYRTSIYLQELFKEISKKLKLRSVKELYYFTLPEVAQALSCNKPLNRQSIMRRQKSFILISDAGGYVLFEGEKAKRLANKYRTNIVKPQRLSGRVAFLGKVQGRVVIVRGLNDFKKVIPGSILVSQSTQPNYVPILKKVRAIVTEEGGVLSHASVISRELKIPCIIGTKIATRVLKDGDIVEVDATKGVVKKLVPA